MKNGRKDLFLVGKTMVKPIDFLLNKPSTADSKANNKTCDTHSQTVGRQLSFTDIFLVVSHYFPKSIALYPNLLMVETPVCKCVYIICIYSMILFYKYISYVHIYIYVHTRHIHNMCCQHSSCCCHVFTFAILRCSKG